MKYWKTACAVALLMLASTPALAYEECPNAIAEVEAAIENVEAGVIAVESEVLATAQLLLEKGRQACAADDTGDLGLAILVDAKRLLGVVER